MALLVSRLVAQPAVYTVVSLRVARKCPKEQAGVVSDALFPNAG